MVFQETSLVPSMTVAQNLYLGDEKLFNRLRGIYIAAQTFLSSMNFSVDPWATVSTLGAAQKQMVEIARAVRQNARIIIFDEPTASLTPEEKYYFFSLMKKLKGRGVSIIFISHALEEALQNADRITVLRDGELVVTDVAVNFDRDKIIRAMVGRALSGELYSRKGGRRKTRRAGEKVLSVQNLSMGTIVRNNSFTIYAGQITGVFGLIGAGRSETAKIIAGIVKRDFFTAAKCGCSADRCVIECHDRRSGTALFTSLKIGSLKAFLKQCRSRRICRLAPYRPIRADASLCVSRRCVNWRTSGRKRSTSMHSTPTRES
jgi:simple sugar transport system ATP-binding protein